MEEERCCIVCKKPLIGEQQKYCSHECLKVVKRINMRKSREIGGNCIHDYACRKCGKEIVLGRRRKRVDEVITKCA